MLILRRKVDDVVVIFVPRGTGKPMRIEVMLTEIDRRNSQVALGFKAPPGVIILRKELE